MNKPKAFNETKASGSYTPVELGGHYMVIKKVEEMTSKTGKPMVKIMFDFDTKDKQPGYFMDSFKSDKRKDKKWSNQATAYLLTEDDDGNCSSKFKGFCTSVEGSNNGFTVKWGDEVADWSGQFKDKKVGGIFGEELDYYNGEIKHKRVLRWFCSTDKVESAAIPGISRTKAYDEIMDGKRSEEEVSSGDYFLNVSDIEEDLPFK